MEVSKMFWVLLIILALVIFLTFMNYVRRDNNTSSHYNLSCKRVSKDAWITPSGYEDYVRYYNEYRTVPQCEFENDSYFREHNVFVTTESISNMSKNDFLRLLSEKEQEIAKIKPHLHLFDGWIQEK